VKNIRYIFLVKHAEDNLVALSFNFDDVASATIGTGLECHENAQSTTTHNTRTDPY